MAPPSIGSGLQLVIRGGERTRLALVASGFTLFALVIVGDFLFSSDRGFPSHAAGDVARFFVFLRSFGYEELSQGNMPLWNPHSFSGTPFVGQFQSAMFYPPNLIYLLLPVDKAINLEFALHIVLLGVFSFAWLRGRGMQPMPAFFGATLATLGAPNFLRYLAGGLSVIDTLVWSPLLFLAIDKLARRASLGWILLGVFSVTMMVLAGHPPTLFMVAVATGLYCVEPGIRSGRRLHYVASLVPIAVAPLFLSAVQLWTFLEASLEGIRAGGMAYDFATSFSFPPENFLTLLGPEAFGHLQVRGIYYFGRWMYWDASAHIGLMGLVLAIVGIVKGRSQVRRVALILMIVLFVLSLGRYTPIYSVVYQLVPGFEYFRAPSKFMFHWALFMGVLAAVGIERALEDARSARLGALVAAVLALLATALTLFARCVPPTEEGGGSLVQLLAATNDSEELEWWLVLRWQEILESTFLPAIVTCGAACVLLWLGQRHRWAIWAVVAMGIVELVVFAHTNRGGADIDTASFFRPKLASTYERAKSDRVLLAGSTSNVAIAARGFDIWGYDPMVLGRYATFMASTQGREVAELNNIGGSHPDIIHPLLSMLRLRYSVSEMGTVIEHAEPLPRFLVLRDYRVVGDMPAVLEALFEADFDPARSVILEEPPIPSPASSGGNGEAGEVRVVSESTDHLALEVELESPAILVITDAYAKGWRLSEVGSGSPVQHPILPGNYVLRAIPLAAGAHQLRLEYAPAAYAAGMWASTISAALYLVALGGWCWRSRLQRADAAGT